MKLTPNPSKIKKITRTSLDLMGSIYWQCLAGSTVFPVKTASRFRIPLIIWGCHQGVDQVGMFSHLDEVEMTRRYRKNHDLMGFEAEDILEQSDLKESDVFEYFYPEDSEIEQIGIKGLYLNNYMRWDTMKQHEQMIKFYNYETKDLNTTFDNCNDVDCYHYSGIHDLIKFYKFGYSKITDHVSREIRFNRITKEEGINFQRNYTPRSPKDIKGPGIFSKWVGMKQEEIFSKVNKHRDKRVWKKLSNKWRLIGNETKPGKALLSKNQLIKLSNEKKGEDDKSKDAIIFAKGWHE